MVLGGLGNFAILRSPDSGWWSWSASERMPMLLPYSPPRFDEEDQRLFDALVPFDHWTRKADRYIDFQALRKSIEPFFKDSGRPAIEPVLFLKLELLMYHDQLSDSQVMARAQTDLAYWGCRVTILCRTSARCGSSGLVWGWRATKGRFTRWWGRRADTGW